MNEVKSTPWNKMILGKDHLVLINDARSGGDDNTCNSNGDDSKVKATETNQGLKSISIGMERGFPFETQTKPTRMGTKPS